MKKLIYIFSLFIVSLSFGKSTIVSNQLNFNVVKNIKTNIIKSKFKKINKSSKLYPIYVYTSCGVAIQTNQNWTIAQVEAYADLCERIHCGN